MSSTVQLTPESELIDQIARGGADAVQAFTALVCQTRTGFVRSSRPFGISPADAEEIVNDTYMAIWQNPALFQGKGTGTKGFIWVAIKHKLIDRWRKIVIRAHRELSTTVPSVDNDGEAVDESIYDMGDTVMWETSSTELALENDLKKECYDECLKGLSQVHQQVLELTLVSGLHPSEIAETFDQKIETVKTRLHYAAKKITGCVTNCSNGHKA